MNSPNSFPQPSETNPRSILETHGDVEITREGVTLPLRTWLNFCPIPHEEMDPVKLEEYARAFLKGKDPLAQP